MKRLAPILAGIFLLWSSLAFATVTANSCANEAGSAETVSCTATLAVTIGTQLAYWENGRLNTGSALTTPSDGVNSPTQTGGLSTISNNSQIGGLWIATAASSTTLTVTFNATATASSTMTVGGVILDLGASTGSDSSMNSINTAASSSSLSVSASLSTTKRDTVVFCAGMTFNETMTSQLASFSIPTNGQANHTGVSAACTVSNAVLSAFSYTGGTEVFSVSTSEAYVIGVVGFTAPSQSNLLTLGVGE